MVQARLPEALEIKTSGQALVRSERRIALLIFLPLLVCYAYFFPRWADWNQNSRLNLVMAVVDRGVLYIDDYYEGYTATGDYAEYEGHIYSTKAPGSGFLGVPVYWAFQKVVGGGMARWALGLLRSNEAVGTTLTAGGSGLLPEKLHAALALYLVTLFTVSIPSALLGVLLYRSAGHFVPAPAPRVWAVLAYGLATSAFPYSGSFYGHQIVAVLLFVAFYLSFLIGRGKLSPAFAVGVGGLLGYAVITEYPAALVAGAVLLYLYHRLPQKRWVGLAILGGLLPGLLWMGYNLAIFHKPVAFGYEHAPLWQDVNTAGFFSLVYPQPEALWGITFGSFRGLFFLSPVLLLAIPGLYRLARDRAWRPEGWVSLWAAVGFLLFNGSSVMWQGGYAVGSRYLVPMLPFLVLPLALFAEGWGRRGWARGLIGVLSIWSLLAVWAETIGGQQFPDYTPNPLFRYSLPRLLAGDIARNLSTVVGLSGWLSLAPLIAVLGCLSWVLARRLMTRRTALQEGL
ncbi:MAG TPA: hypothetical protein EYH30_05845 [Anaerolineales bacterium]|nr:hypothetical protein [Anaerolineae bacterium]HIQ01635.1 hypothetical protein [Anaerolineales bacterium]